jgi:hypothetical protein
LWCRVQLDEMRSDKEMQRMGKQAERNTRSSLNEREGNPLRAAFTGRRVG